jgi:hypothetical protein
VNRVDHRLLGGAWGLGAGALAHAGSGAPLGVVLGCGAIAACTAGGVLSPDVDQRWRARTVRFRFLGVRYERRVGPGRSMLALRAGWRGWAWLVTRSAGLLAARLPGWRCLAGVRSTLASWRAEAGRHGDPVQHRGITHNWTAPVAAEVVLAVLTAVGWAAGWQVPWWPFWAALLGWWSHLAGDLVHGRQVWGQDGHGVPLSPWWDHAGVGLKSAGWTAHVVAWGVAVPVSVLLVKVAAGI